MPQKRNAKSAEAERLYRGGGKLVDIAKALGVPDGTVRRWKSDQGWEGKARQPGRSDSKANACPNARIKEGPNADKSKAPQGRGKTCGDKTNDNAQHPMARPGNTHALGNRGGNGAPPRNKHAVKTHEYVKVFFTVDVIDEEERALIDSDYDKYVQQYTLIDTLSVREKRMMRDIKELRRDPDGTDRATGLEEALTRVQARKQRAVENLHRMECDEIRIAIELARLQLHKQKLAGAFNLEDLLDDDLLDMSYEA